MSNKTQIKLRSLEFGDKFTLHPQSDKYYWKHTEHQKPDGTLVSVKCTRVCLDLGVCYYDPDHVVYIEEGA